MPNFRLVFRILAIGLASLCLAWQDDVPVILRDHAPFFPKGQGLSYLGGALAEVRLGRYLVADTNFGWRGAVGGDVGLLNFGNSLTWHMGLNMETLADDQNDIHFRLVQVYYEAKTGIKWLLGDGVFHFGYRHRCSHGTDQAEKSRITIRSGLTAAYTWSFIAPKVRLDLEPGANIYLLGQNRDVNAHPRGNLFLSAQGIWPLKDPLFLVVSTGAVLEFMSSGHRPVYVISDGFSRFWIEALFGTRLALRVQKNQLKSDFALQMAQNLDSGIRPLSRKTVNISLDIDFLF